MSIISQHGSEVAQRTTRTIRVFISSPFRDMEQERNALHESVFPRLRRICAKRGWLFEPIDLRWGVSEAAALDQRILQICLDEVIRCQEVSPRPNFIALLGDRYGTPLLPENIPVGEFRQLLLRLKGTPESKLLRHWYRRDGNAVPPYHTLRARSGSFQDYSVWTEQVERPLRNALAGALDELPFSREERLKYFTSATEREIELGVFRQADSHEHVYAFFRTIKNLPRDARASRFNNVSADGTHDEEAAGLLLDLKRRVTDRLGASHAFQYEAKWAGGGVTADHLRGLCEDVYRALAGIIQWEIEAFDLENPLRAESLAHRSFGEERARAFVGREEPLQAISDYIGSQSSRPFAVFGEPGTGKTALLARAAELAREHWPGARVVVRFAGATSAAGNVETLLRGVFRELDGEEPSFEEEATLQDNYLTKQFEKALAASTADAPTIVFLDALDQLSGANHPQDLRWLPFKLPPHSYLIVSTLGGRSRDLLQKLLPVSNATELKLMEADEAVSLLDSWLRLAGRTLIPRQRWRAVECVRRHGLPLYVKLVAEHVRHWRSFDPAGHISGDVEGILNSLIQKLSDEAQHGALLVSKSLGYLQAARRGLSDNEMLELLALDDEYFPAFLKGSFHALPGNGEARQLPAVVWLRLYADLRPYLSERAQDGTSLIGFYHGVLREYAERHFLLPEKKRSFHRALAGYFARREQGSGEQEGAVLSLRQLSELPYQLAAAEMWSELTQTLTDYDFVSEKCGAELVDDLLGDYKRAAARADEALRQWENFVGSRAHMLRRYAPQWSPDRTLLQLATECAEESVVRRAAEAWLDKGEERWPRLTDVTMKHYAFRRVMEGHRSGVLGALVLSSGEVLSWSFDGLLIIWDVESGAERILLEGHTSYVRGAAELPDGNLLSWSEDKTLKVWNPRTGAVAAELEGHAEAVAGARLLDGGRLISWGYGTELILWDLKTFSMVARLEGHKQPIVQVVALPNGRVVSASGDKVLAWRLEDLRPIEAHGVSDIELSTLIVLEDGRCIWSGPPHVMFMALRNDEWVTCPAFGWSEMGGNSLMGIAGAITLPGGEIITWDPLSRDVSAWLTLGMGGDRGATVNSDAALELARSVAYRAGVFSGHERPVVGAKVVSENRFVSWSKDHTLILWEAARRSPVGEEFIEEGQVRQKTYYVANGNFKEIEELIEEEGISTVESLLSRLSTDGRLDESAGKNGDSVVGRQLASFVGHTGAIKGALLRGDGTLLSWAEDSTIRFWDVETGACLRTLKSPSKDVDEVVTLADGRFVSYSHESPDLVLWDDEPAEASPRGTYTSRRITGCRYFREGRMVSWAEDNSLQMWDTDTGSYLGECRGHSRPVKGLMQDDSETFVTWSSDCTLRVWKHTGECQSVLAGHSKAVEGALLAPGSILSWADDQTARVWDRGGVCRAVLQGHTKKILGARLLSGERAASWSRDGTVKVWDWGGAQAGSTCGPVADCLGHEKTVAGVLPLSRGRLLSWSWDGSLRIWDERTGECLRVLRRHTDSVNGALLLPDERLVSWSDDAMLCVWDASEGDLICSLEGHEGGVTDCQVVGDSMIVSRSRGGELRCWDIGSGACLGVATFGGVSRMLLVREGLLMVSTNTTNYSWDFVSAPEPVRHVGPTMWAALGGLDLKGRGKIAWSLANELLLWDGETGRLLVPEADHDARPFAGSLARTWQTTAPAVLPDGRLLLPINSSQQMLWDPLRGTGHRLRLEHKKSINFVLTLGPSSSSESVALRPQVEALADAASFGVSFIVLRPEWRCVWHTDRDIARMHYLLPDGTIVVSLQDGDFAFLKLMLGSERLRLFGSDVSGAAPVRD